jgi:hypothetical protein
MKNLTLVGIITVLVMVLSGCSKDKYEKESTTVLETGFTNDNVINVAKAYLPTFKASIMTSNVSQYGFNSLAELDQIQIGTPFLWLGLTSDFRKDSIYDCFNKYIVNGKEWWVPLMVGNDIRRFLWVCFWKDSLQYVGDGGYAKSVDDCLKKYNIQSENRYIIEEHVYGNCVFIMTNAGDNLAIYPVREFLPIGDWNPTYCENLDKVYYSFKDLFNEFKNEGSCFGNIDPGQID